MSKYIEEHLFEFDRCFDEYSSNFEIYREVVQPLIREAFSKIKITCFSYGQTGSGKTFTMLGNESNNLSLEENSGLIILTAHDIFTYLQHDQFSHLEIYISFYEIYCEKIFDLLNERSPVMPLEDKNSTVNLKNLTEQQVWDKSDFTRVVMKGLKARTVGVTGANADSSRSHALIEINIREPQGKNFSKIVFVDLAGTERAVDVIETNKQTRFDTGKINEGLFALKECIRALRANSNYIPFRKNQLTFVLKDYFCAAKTKMIMITNITPTLASVEYTLNSLRYAKMLKNDKVDETTVKYDVFEKVAQPNKIPAIIKEDFTVNPHFITNRYVAVSENPEKTNQQNNKNNQSSKNNNNNTNTNNNKKNSSNNLINLDSNLQKNHKKENKKINEATISNLLKKAEFKNKSNNNNNNLNNSNLNNKVNNNNSISIDNKKNIQSYYEQNPTNNINCNFMNNTTHNINSSTNYNNLNNNNSVNINNHTYFSNPNLNNKNNVNSIYSLTDDNMFNLADSDIDYSNAFNINNNSYNNGNNINNPYNFCKDAITNENNYLFYNTKSNSNLNNLNKNSAANININKNNNINCHFSQNLTQKPFQNQNFAQNNDHLANSYQNNNNFNANLNNENNNEVYNNQTESEFYLNNNLNNQIENKNNKLNNTFNNIQVNNQFNNEINEEINVNNTYANYLSNHSNTEIRELEDEYQNIYEVMLDKKKKIQDELDGYIKQRFEFQSIYEKYSEKLKSDEPLNVDAWEFFKGVVKLETKIISDIEKMGEEMQEIEKTKFDLAQKINDYRNIFPN